MVEERVTDGRRIAELLSSELHGREDGGLDRIAVVDARGDVEPTVDGSRAYEIALVDEGNDDTLVDEHDEDIHRDGRDDDRKRLGAVYVHPGRAHVELRAGLESAVEVARERGLRVRPKAVEPPRTLVFVESGAEVKRAADAVSAAAASNAEDGEESGN